MPQDLLLESKMSEQVAEEAEDEEEYSSSDLSQADIAKPTTETYY